MKWLRRMGTSPQHPRARLLAFPHAGGWSSSFTPWRRQLPDDIDLLVAQLPGREKRSHEPNADSLETVVSRVAGELEDDPDTPLILIGHSFGALVSYETTRSLRSHGRAVDRLVVSGRQPPSFSNHPPFASGVSDDELLSRLVDMGGISVALQYKPNLMQPFLEAIRADLRLMEQHQRPIKPCDVPITAVHASADPVVIGPRLRLWSLETTADFEFIELEGGHFGVFQRDQINRLFERLGLVSQP